MICGGGLLDDWILEFQNSWQNTLANPSTLLNHPSFPKRRPLPDDLSVEVSTSEDYSSALFDLFSDAGSLAVFFAQIQYDSPSINKIGIHRYACLVGLLMRCGRLTLANIALSHKGYFGETTAILDRCLFESSIILAWLCSGDDNYEERFNNYFAKGLHSELPYISLIQDNIEQRGQPLPIEDRMLKAKESYFQLAQLSQADVHSAKKLPHLETMIEQLGYEEIVYITNQKFGSHPVHGSWPNLLMMYISFDGSKLTPVDHDTPTNFGQYGSGSILLLNGLEAFVSFCVSDEADAGRLMSYISLFRQCVENSLLNGFEVLDREHDECQSN